MDAKKFKDDLTEVLKRHCVFPQHPGRLVLAVNVSPELKIGEVRLTPELVIK